MKKVYLANKSTFGSEFIDTYDSLQELKQAIYDNFAYGYDYSEKYEPSEQAIKECIKDAGLSLYEVNLHDDEDIIFDQYDGQSWFTVVKKPEFILSTTSRIEL